MKLQVVKTDKGYVAISDEPIRCDEASGLIGNIWYVFEGIIYKREYSHPKNCSKIIATDTTFKLEGIPQFELEKLEDDEPLAEADFKHLGYKTGKQDFKVGFVRGYRAAQSKGCFTEEDIKRALILKNIGYGEKYILDSLKQSKKLVAIEVETERRNVLDIDEQGQMGYTTIDALKSSNALLTIKQYFYE